MEFTVGARHAVMAVTIRGVRPGDAESIAANVKTANTPSEIRSQLQVTIGKSYDHIVAVTDDGVAVGNALLMPTRYFPVGAHRGELAHFVVALSHRGTDVSHRLMEAIVQAARARGMTQLDTSTRATGPIAAFQRLGLVEWGRMPRAFRDTAEGYAALVFFALPLDEYVGDRSYWSAAPICQDFSGWISSPASHPRTLTSLSRSATSTRPAS